MTPVRLEPAASRSRVKHSTTEPLRSRKIKHLDKLWFTFSEEVIIKFFSQKLTKHLKFNSKDRYVLVFVKILLRAEPLFVFTAMNVS